MKWILCLLLICGNVMAFTVEEGQKLPQLITYTCPDSLADSTDKAFKLWNWACDNYFTIKRVDTKNPTVNIIYDTSINLGKNSDGVSFLAMTYIYGDSANIIIVGDTDLDSIILHELGHAFGLNHVNDKDSIMFPYVSIETYIDQDDIDGIRTIYELSPKSINFTLLVKRHTVTCKSLYGTATFLFSDGLTKSGRTIKRKFPIGIYDVLMYWNNVKIRKTFTIK